MTDPRPRPDATTYGQDYYQRAFGLDELRRFNMHWWSVRLYALLARRLLRRARGRRFLDVGCAHGYTLSWLEGEFETWGVDISPYAIERARTIAPRSRVYQADVLGEIPDEVGQGGFDVILAKYVLEHLPDPGRALRRLHGLLAPGGALLYAVPDTRSPSRRFRGEQWYALLDETHVSLWEPAAWLDATREAGFAVESARDEGVWDLPWIPFVPRVLQIPLFALPTVATVLLARPFLPIGWGENVIVVARRPGVTS